MYTQSWEIPVEEFIVTKAADIKPAGKVKTELSNFWGIFWVFALPQLGHFGHIFDLILKISYEN